MASTGTSISITGPAAGVTISGGGKSRVFQIDSRVSVSFSELSITAGSATGSGGGLLSNGNVSLAGCFIGGNSRR